MKDRDLAELFQVEAKQVKRQVRRYIDSFPESLFKLTEDEYRSLRTQIATSK